MRNIGICLLVLAVNFACNTVRADAFANGARLEQALFLSLLLDEEPAKAKLGARTAAAQYSNNQEFTDFAAERLIQSTSTDVDKKLAENVIWYANVLRHSRDSRYRELLLQVRQHLTDEKQLKRIDDTLAAVGEQPVAQYIAGTANVAAKRAELQRILLTGKQADRKQFAAMKSGESFDEILETLGTPDDMSDIVVRIAKFGRASRLSAHYANAGLIFFRFDGARSHWVAIEPIDELFPVRSAYSGEHFGIAQNIASLRGEPFRYYLKAYGAPVKKDPQLIGILGKRLIAFPYPADKFEDSANTLAVRMIANSKVADRLELLHKIAAAREGKRASKAAAGYARKIEKGIAFDKEKEPAEDEADSTTEKDADKDSDKEDL